MFEGRQWRPSDGPTGLWPVDPGWNRLPWHQMCLPKPSWGLHEDDILQTVDRKGHWGQFLGRELLGLQWFSTIQPQTFVIRTVFFFCFTAIRNIILINTQMCKSSESLFVAYDRLNVFGQ